MKVYIVRSIEDRKFQGVFWAQTKADLWDTFDQFGDPYGYEFAKLTTPGAIVHPGAGITIPQWDETDDDDLVGEDDMTWEGFEEDEMLTEALRCQSSLKWEPFCHAGEKYGMLARIKREADSRAANDDWPATAAA